MISDLIKVAGVLLLFFVFITIMGCASFTDTRTRVVDRPDETPMVLPEWGYNISFVRTWNDDDPDEPAETECTVVRNESGASGDYCGYLIYVTENGFSFDSAPYRAVSWFYGPVIVDVDGAGDATGAEITTHVEFADFETWEPWGLAYDLRYDIVHVGVIE